MHKNIYEFGILLGHYIPELSKIIVDRNKGVSNPAINFKGFLVSDWWFLK